MSPLAGELTILRLLAEGAVELPPFTLVSVATGDPACLSGASRCEPATLIVPPFSRSPLGGMWIQSASLSAD